jgi:outer membrane immunogenic protein
MKKTLIVIGAVVGALVAGSAMAADMPARGPAPMMMKAPPPPVASWTGCYISAGVGYGMFNVDHDIVGEAPAVPGALFTPLQSTGGRGWLGRAGIGCDYQIGSNWLIGAFGDWDWSNIKSQQYLFTCPGGCAAALPVNDLVDGIKQKWAWGAGARIGYLVTPALLTYVDGGFTSARFGSANVNVATTGAFTGGVVPEQTFNGYFIGSGYEYAVGFIPGVYWKTEYRFSDLRNTNVSLSCTTAACAGVVVGGPLGVSDRMHPYVQTVVSNLTYHFGMH